MTTSSHPRKPAHRRTRSGAPPGSGRAQHPAGLGHDDTGPLVFEPPPDDVDARVNGSAAILRYLDSVFPGGPSRPGALALLLLDRRSLLLAQARTYALAPVADQLTTFDRARYLRDALAGMRADPRALGGYACLLVVTRDGPPAMRESDVSWYSALRAACSATGLRAADVLVDTGQQWFTVRAGTSGAAP